MPGKRRPPCARAIIYAAAIGGLDMKQANQLLEDAGLGMHAVPESSWQWICRDYVPYFKEHPAKLGEMIYSPKPVGDFVDD